MRQYEKSWAHSDPSGAVGDDGQRPCARGQWCASSVITVEDGQTRRDPALGYQSFCPRDREHISRCLDELPGLYVRLHAELGAKGSGGGEHVSGSRDAPIPLRCDIDALMRLVTECLYSWHERVAAVASLSFPTADLSRRRRDGIGIDAAVNVLGAHLDALLALDAEPMARSRPDGPALEDLDGAAAGLEILRLHYLARSLLGETRAKPQELLGVPCRNVECNLMALQRADLPVSGDEPAWWSRCTGCGDKMTEDDYRAWVKRYADYLGGAA